MKITMVFISSLFFLFLLLLIYSQQEKFIFSPYPLANTYTYSFPENFEEISWNVEEDVTINALHFKVNDPKGVVLYFHGNAGNLAGWGGIAKVFISHNYNVIIYDYRGYGKSTGKIHSEKDLLQDAVFAYEYTKSLYAESSITLYGRSLGSGLAVYLAKNNKPARLILETPYNNFVDVAKFHFPYIPSFLMKYKLDSENSIEFVKCPIYIFHGTEDQVIPLEYARKLESKIVGEYKFFLITNAGHNDISETKEYFLELNKILR